MEKLEFVDSERMLVVFSTLVIRVGAIKEKTRLCAKEFIESYNLWGATNGKLLIICDMTLPSDSLENIVFEILEPLGFIRKEDWEITFERDSYNNAYESGYLFKEIPELEGLNWVDSILLEDGNWIWSKDEND